MRQSEKKKERKSIERETGCTEAAGRKTKKERQIEKQKGERAQAQIIDIIKLLYKLLLYIDKNGNN